MTPKNYNPSTAIPYPFHEVVYVNQEITNLNHRYKFKCPKCNTQYPFKDIINDFLRMNYENSYIQQVTANINCNNCHKHYRLLLSLRLPTTVDYVKYAIHMDTPVII